MLFSEARRKLKNNKCPEKPTKLKDVNRIDIQFSASRQLEIKTVMLLMHVIDYLIAYKNLDGQYERLASVEIEKDENDVGNVLVITTKLSKTKDK